MTAKYQRVASPHEHTFDWIFEKNGDFRPLDNHLSSMTLESDENNSFEEWMRSQTQKKSNMKNLYWIVGKAGSGKSTLMKHVFQHPKTDQSLSHWKGTSQLLKAAYFFERGQSSEERLLQTLLYQVLAHDQSIIVKVYKERWEQFSKFKDIREKRPDPPAKSKFPKFDKNGIDLDILGLDDLFNALNRTAKLICASTKLFFLIDGLDEIVGVDESSSEDQRTAYEKCQSLSKIISEIAKNENIKICISSRPHLGFEDEEGGLEGCSRLELEKVTGPDITCYVDSQLGQSKGFAQLAKNDPQAANEICQDIKDRASGMFLWVSLVVKLLIDGINHRSRLHDLKQKVRLLPKELTGESGLYMQMLRSVGHGQYLERARIISILAQSFQIDIALSPLLLDFAEEVDAIEDLIEEKNLKKFDAERSLQRVKDRLKGCCGGIFEVRSIAPLSKNGMTHDIYNDYVVDAVHGTVWEFLAEPEAAMELSKFPPDMSVLGPRTSLVRAAILSLHFIPPTVKKNRKERSKLCLDLVSSLLFAVEYSFSWNQETGEDQHALGQWEREGVQLFSKLISVFDQVGSKAHEKTRGFFESSGRHWIYAVDEKLFTYFDDYESYMISWLLEARIIFCAEYLLFGLYPLKTLALVWMRPS
ncbi:hypothetical protein IG631_23815 [Alternaria alternata]|nr:hypothetical protein IG631_23815 [Alternaria alternata]